jgi:hypothetical protein
MEISKNTSHTGAIGDNAVQDPVDRVKHDPAHGNNHDRD